MQYFDPIEYGALGDGAADDTLAFQQAIDEAAQRGGTVFVKPGVYRVGELMLRPGVYIKADPVWSYGGPDGGAVLIPRGAEQECVLDLAAANGATVEGLVLDGRQMGLHMCGITARRSDFGKREDAWRIERCKVSGFSEHAVFLNCAWCFSVRHCMFAFSGGDGLRLHGWDGFIMDNWFSGNKGAGYGTEGGNCSVTMTGNRIEWNERGGIVIESGSLYNITGNYIDRSGGPAIELTPARRYHNERQEHYDACPHTISCTGNVLYRSGKTAEGEKSCHIFMDRCFGAAVTGNTLCIGRDDGWQGRYSPDYGMVLSSLYDCSVSGNTLFLAAARELLLDKGGHGGSTIIRDNPGTLVPPEAMAPGAKHPLSIPHMMAEAPTPWFSGFFEK